MADRRQFLVGAGLLAAAAPLKLRAQPTSGSGATRQADRDFIYDYLFVEVTPGERGSTQKAVLDHLKGAGIRAIRSAGGEAIGYFTPLIGWSSQHFAILLRWSAQAPAREQAVAALASHPAIRGVDRSRLAATTRPLPTDLPKTTGIYTHRWFDVKTSDVPEFVELSNNAWPYFEREFASIIFGLFRSCPTTWCSFAGAVTAISGMSRAGHAAIAGSVTIGLSPSWATLSSVI